MTVKSSLLVSSVVAAVAAGCSEPRPAAAPHSGAAPASAGAAGAASVDAENAGVQMTVSSTIRAMAVNPAPPPHAQRATSIGTRALRVDTRNSPTDTDATWIEQLDLNGDGILDTVTLLWDDEDRVLYLYSELTFVCRNGGLGSGGTLVELNATGNPRNRPVGSGFYATFLDESECGARVGGLWGCRFDANGHPTGCGWLTIDASRDDVVVTQGAVVP